MSIENLSPEEIQRRGEELYVNTIRPTLSEKDTGRFVAIDVISGQYAVADDDATASLEMLKRGSGDNLYGIRIGQEAAYKIGGQSVKGHP